MSKRDIKNLINENITDNNSQAITAKIMRETLDGMVDGLAIEESAVFELGTGTNSVQQKGTGAAASGVGAVAEGSSTAYGQNSHAEGNSTFANGQNSHTEGSGTIADGVTSHVEGVSNTTINEGEHSEGKYNITIQNKTIHTVGVGNKTNNVITRKNGHLIDVDGKHYIPGIGGYHGTETVFTNIKDLATVINDIPVEKGTGTNSVQQKGSGATASGNNSYAEGGSTAKAQRSHAEGNGCTAETTATNSHVEGYQNTVNGVASHAEGRNNTTTNEAEHAEGKYNVSISGVTLHTVGIGTSASKKKNAHIITTDGKHYIPGVGGYVGTETDLTGKTDLATVINNKQDKHIQSDPAEFTFIEEGKWYDALEGDATQICVPDEAINTTISCFIFNPSSSTETLECYKESGDFGSDTTTFEISPLSLIKLTAVVDSLKHATWTAISNINPGPIFISGEVDSLPDQPYSFFPDNGQPNRQAAIALYKQGRTVILKNESYDQYVQITGWNSEINMIYLGGTFETSGNQINTWPY